MAARLGLLTLGALLLTAGSTSGQAWLPPAGAGSVNIAVQRIDHGGHRLTDGTLVPDGKSLNVGIYVEMEYALTDRLGVSVGLPYVFGRFIGPNPPPPPIPFLPVDQCYCWNRGWQDIGLTARYNLWLAGNRSFALTPSVSIGVPSHDYAYRGEAVVGRHLKELRAGVDVGQRLDRISPRLSMQATYVYARVERVLDIPNDRSNATVAGAFQITRKLSARGLMSWQRTHGGLRLGSPVSADLPWPGDVDTPERLEQHDRLLRDNSTHAGVAATYLFRGMDVFGSYVRFEGGTDTHAGGAFTLGVSVPFEFAIPHSHQ